MSSSKPISEPGKMLLLASLLAKQRVISNNAKAFLKELVLRRDSRLTSILQQFENKSSKDSEFLEELHELIRKYALPQMFSTEPNTNISLISLFI